MTPKQCEKECQSINIIKWVCEFNIFFLWKDIKVNSLFKYSHCAFVKQEFTRQRLKETISGSIQRFQCLGVRADIWERCAVTWAVRGSERAKFIQEFACARLPGRCADIWERRADIWAARGFQAI